MSSFTSPALYASDMTKKRCVRRCMRTRMSGKFICLSCHEHTERTGDKKCCQGAKCYCAKVKPL